MPIFFNTPDVFFNTPDDCCEPDCPGCEAERLQRRAEVRKVAKVNGNAWWFKLYCRVWYADPQQADFCKLFWGLLLLPLGLLMNLGLAILFVILWPPVTLGRKLKDRARKQAEMKEMEKRQPLHPDKLPVVMSKAKRQARRAIMMRAFLQWWSRQAERLFALVGPLLRLPGRLIWGIARPIERVVNRANGRWPWMQYIPLMVVVASVTYLLGYCLWLLGGVLPWFILVGFIAGCALGGLIILAARSETVVTGATHAVGVVKTPTIGLFRALGIGYHALKDRTCPVIEVEND